jgi:transcriptional regulator with XRE-family HTH domain
MAADTLGDRLAVLLDDLKKDNVTAQNLAARLGINASYLSKIKQNIHVPSAAFLYHLWQQTGVNLHWLITGEGDRYAPAKALQQKEIEYYQTVIESIRVLLCEAQQKKAK